MSNHFTGLSLGPPLGDQRLDLCDLYAFQSPTDSSRTVLILNANPNADALHPDAIYRLAIDTDGDLVNDIAFSFVFSTPVDGRQTVNVFMARGEQSRSPEPVGEQIFTDVEVSFGAAAECRHRRRHHVRRRRPQRCLLLRLRRHQEPVRHQRQAQFHRPHLAELGGKSPWTGQDSNTEANVFSMAIELPTSTLGASGPIRIWGRCSLRENGSLNHVDRAGHPSVSSFFNTDDTKLEYNASEPPNDWNRWLDQFVHLMGHTGGYTREEAIAAIEKEGTLPDMLTFDPAKPAQYPNGRVFTDDVIDYRLAFLTKGECPPSGLSPHTRHPDRVPLPRPAARRAGSVGPVTATPREFDIVLYGATGFVGQADRRIPGTRRRATRGLRWPAGQPSDCSRFATPSAKAHSPGRFWPPTRHRRRH